MLYSVVAAIDGRNDDGDHLPLRPAQRRTAAHQVRIQIIMRLHRLGVQAVDGQDVVDSTPRLLILFVQLLQPPHRLHLRR